MEVVQIEPKLITFPRQGNKSRKFNTRGILRDRVGRLTVLLTSRNRVYF